jgi:ABC-type transport system substrate-binding protein
MLRSSLKLFISVLLLSTLSACASYVAPPSTPPIYDGTAPELKEGRYAVYETQRAFNAPLEPLRLFIEDGNKIVSAMEETENIKKPVDVVVLSGTWPEEGSVRRLEFSDGHYTLERVLKNDFPTLFRYQVWDFTAASGRHLDYALGQQAWEVLPNGQSQLTWTYKLRPNAGFKRPIAQRFINSDMKPLMDNALDVVVEQANENFANQ